MFVPLVVRDWIALQYAEPQENLSAGPLEDLLVYHGHEVIDRVESEARSNPKFASLLGGVWKNAMADDIWRRIQGVWDRRDWDGITRD